MKKKRFYNNKKRNEKWTEPQRGRKIDFADKYINAGSGSDKYDKKRKKERKPFFGPEKRRTAAKILITAVGCFLIMSIGYTVMDLYMERNSMPLTQDTGDSTADISDVSLHLKSMRAESLVMDSGVMLDAVIDDVTDSGYTSVTFDLKRDDGTIGYDSGLATVDVYGAESSAAADMSGSVSTLLANDILPVGRISCYKDNIAAAGDLTAGIKVDGELYTDSDGNSYLNPDSATVYNYIKGIIEEAAGFGITVFVLDNCDLPEDIAEGYNDGFDALANKLYNDFGSEIKLLRSVNVSVDGEDDEAIQFEWQEKTADISGKDVIFNVSAKDTKAVKAFLDQQENINYILSE